MRKRGFKSDQDRGEEITALGRPNPRKRRVAVGPLPSTDPSVPQVSRVGSEGFVPSAMALAPLSPKDPSQVLWTALHGLMNKQSAERIEMRAQLGGKEPCILELRPRDWFDEPWARHWIQISHRDHSVVVYHMQGEKWTRSTQLTNENNVDEAYDRLCFLWRTWRQNPATFIEDFQRSHLTSRVDRRLPYWEQEKRERDLIAQAHAQARSLGHPHIRIEILVHACDEQKEGQMTNTVSWGEATLNSPCVNRARMKRAVTKSKSLVRLTTQLAEFGRRYPSEPPAGLQGASHLMTQSDQEMGSATLQLQLQSKTPSRANEQHVTYGGARYRIHVATRLLEQELESAHLSSRSPWRRLFERYAARLGSLGLTLDDLEEIETVLADYFNKGPRSPEELDAPRRPLGAFYFH